MDGLYSVVAGHVDGNETFRTAMVREAQEEAGILLRNDDLHLVQTMHRFADGERLSLFFEAKASDGDIRNMEPHKCDDLDWYSLADLASNLVPYVKSALVDVSKGSVYSEFGW